MSAISCLFCRDPESSEDPFSTEGPWHARHRCGHHEDTALVAPDPNRLDEDTAHLKAVCPSCFPSLMPAEFQLAAECERLAVKVKAAGFNFTATQMRHTARDLKRRARVAS